VVKNISCFFIFILSQLIFSPFSFALTQVTATIDKNPVEQNESFILQVTADDDVDTDALDTSALRQDFIVGSTSVSSQTSMVNFNTTRTTTWTTLLIPKRVGKVIIPALTVKDKKTAPIALVVVKKSASDASNTNKDVFISTEVSDHQVYVQQQFTLTVKLHFAAELKRGSLTDPTLSGATITQIGKDKESNDIINGKRYRIIERTYAINPQQSGDFILSPPMFSGEIMTNNARRSMFLSFADSKPISVVADDIKIKVNPIPNNYQGDWLPSELLALNEEWQPAKTEFKVGEPITRTIRLTAMGLSEEQLPKITMSMPKGLKVYPDQAENHTRVDQGKLISQKVQNFAIVASKAGTYQIPALTIPWWNTKTNRIQQASLPAVTITVLPSDEPIVQNQTNQPVNQQANNIQKTVIVQQNSILQWIFLAGWILTALAWLTTYLLSRTPNTKKIHNREKVSDDLLSLVKACKQNDGEAVLKQLVPWANSFTGQKYPLHTIDDVIKYFNDDSFTQAIRNLQQCYFAKEPKLWQGNDLLESIKKINKSKIKQQDNKNFSLNP
jgi:hypothetical protein